MVEQGEPGGIAAFSFFYPRLTMRAFHAHAMARGGVFRRRMEKTNPNIGLSINQTRQPQHDFGENDTDREAGGLQY